MYVIAEQGTCVLSKVFVRLLASRSCLTGTALGFSCGYHQEELRVLIRLLLRRYTEKRNESRSVTTKILVYAAKDGYVVFVSRTVLTLNVLGMLYDTHVINWVAGTDRMATTLLQD